VSNCAICPRTAPHGHHACNVCADELRAWLTELPRQARLLEAFVAPSGQPHQGRLGGTGRAHSPAPVDLRVLALLGPGHADAPADQEPDTIPILAFLGAWAGHIAYSYPAAARDPYGTAHTRPCEQAWPSHGPTITGWCAWLTAYLPYTLTLQLVAELHEQLGDLIHRIRDLTHTEPRSHPRTAPCPQCDEFALVRTDGRWHIHCTDCGHNLTPDAYTEYAAAFLQTVQAG
jgi:ribosomal protein L37AE/L43A